MGALQSLDACRHNRAVIAECQLGDGWGGHCISAQERHGDAIIHFLIDQQGQIITAFKCSEDCLSPLGSFGIEIAVQRIPSLLQ